MRKVFRIHLICFVAGFFIVFIAGCSFNEGAEDDGLYETAKGYIKTEKINKNVILVKLGTDAITAVNTEKGIVIIDAGISSLLSTIYRTIISREFNRNNFQYLINTHSHSDHTGGNEAFNDVIIIGHQNCLDEITGSEINRFSSETKIKEVLSNYAKQLEILDSSSAEWNEVYEQILRYQYALKDVRDKKKIVPPSMVFKDSLSINCGKTKVDIFYFGPAHSGSDILIHIPDYKLLMTGDLFFKGGRPSIELMDNKSLAGWKKFETWIEQRWDKIEIIIGGHGQIMENSDLTAFINQLNKKIEIIEQD